MKRYTKLSKTGENSNKISDGLSSRRQFLSRAGIAGLSLICFDTVTSGITSAALPANAVFGKINKLPETTVDTLNFVLMLKYLEAEFYQTALEARNLIPNLIRGAFERISKDKAVHVKLLQSILDGKSVVKPQYDFTGGGAFGDVFSNYQTFLSVAQTFEETALRASIWQAGNLPSGDKAMPTVLKQIHSVEALHAAAIKRIRLDNQCIFSSRDERELFLSLDEGIYNIGCNTKTMEVNSSFLQDVQNSPILSEPLTREQALSITKLFIRNS